MGIMQGESKFTLNSDLEEALIINLGKKFYS